MQGKQHYQMPLFVDGNLEKYVPENHLLRKVSKVLNLKFIRRMTKKNFSKKGRPSLDPVVFFKMQIIAYLYGISSDRQLCEEIKYNLAYRWYLGYPLDQATPEHSTLTRNRDRLGVEFFEKVFERIVADCKKVGLVKGEQVIVDASLIKANASKDSFKPKGNDQDKGQEIEESRKGSKKIKKNETHQSTSDPESTCVNRKGYSGELYYKTHYTIDGKERIILDCHVTTGAHHECNEFINRIDHVTEKFNLNVIEAIADSGYGHGPTYEDLKERGIRSYIPLRDKKLGAGKYSPTEGFEYQRKKDRYRCPVGAYLYPHKPSNGITRYVIKNKECIDCPLQASCFPEGYKNRSKRIQRSEFQDVYDQVRRRQKTKTFQKKRFERSWKVEGLFGEAKASHCLRRAKYRGIDKTQIQVYLTATVQNLKRIIMCHEKPFCSLWCYLAKNVNSWIPNIEFRAFFLKRQYLVHF